MVPAPLGHHLWPVGMRLLAPASAHHTGPTPIADLSLLYELLPEPLINVFGSPVGALLRWQRHNAVGFDSATQLGRMVVQLECVLVSANFFCSTSPPL